MLLLKTSMLHWVLVWCRENSRSQLCGSSATCLVCSVPEDRVTWLPRAAWDFFCICLSYLCVKIRSYSLHYRLCLLAGPYSAWDSATGITPLVPCRTEKTGGTTCGECGPSMAATLGPGGPSMAIKLPWMVRGDRLRQGTIYGVTGPRQGHSSLLLLLLISRAHLGHKC